MKRSMLVGLVSSGVLVLSACSGGGATGAADSSAGPGGKAAQGGTLQVLANAGFSHLDPARGFRRWCQQLLPVDLLRTLTTQGAAPGADSTKIVPDLATDTQAIRRRQDLDLHAEGRAVLRDRVR